MVHDYFRYWFICQFIGYGFYLTWPWILLESIELTRWNNKCYCDWLWKNIWLNNSSTWSSSYWYIIFIIVSVSILIHTRTGVGVLFIDSSDLLPLRGYICLNKTRIYPFVLSEGEMWLTLWFPSERSVRILNCFPILNWNSSGGSSQRLLKISPHCPVVCMLSMWMLM